MHSSRMLTARPLTVGARVGVVAFGLVRGGGSVWSGVDAWSEKEFGACSGGGGWGRCLVRGVGRCLVRGG